MGVGKKFVRGMRRIWGRTMILLRVVSVGVGVGIGNIFSALVTSIARNPAARSEVFGIGILGFALTEAIALFALVVALLLLFAL